ncbi:MAG: DUF805 domain-containing protein [Allosphingosinicella sp.]
MSDGIGYYAFRPLRRFADFGGRSRRSELVVWQFAIVFAGTSLLLAFSLARSDPEPAMTILQLLLLWPTLALLVRRLHDGGLSGWWVLLALPTAADNLYRDWQRFATGEMAVDGFATGTAGIVFGTAFIALFVLLLKPGMPGSNRWGDDPRYDAPEPA